MGIPITKPLYGAYWLVTNAQLELMMWDVSVLVTQRMKDKKKRGKDGKLEFGKPSGSAVSDAARRWQEKYKDGDLKVNMGEWRVINEE